MAEVLRGSGPYTTLEAASFFPSSRALALHFALALCPVPVP
jgi:hypothetical protein